MNYIDISVYISKISVLIVCWFLHISKCVCVYIHTYICHIDKCVCVCVCDFIKMISSGLQNNRGLQGIVSHLRIRMFFISYTKLIAILAVVLDVALPEF